MAACTPRRYRRRRFPPRTTLFGPAWCCRSPPPLALSRRGAERQSGGAPPGQPRSPSPRGWAGLGCKGGGCQRNPEFPMHPEFSCTTAGSRARSTAAQPHAGAFFFLWGRVDCFDLENTQYSSSAFPFPSPRPPNKQQTCGDTSALKSSPSNCFPKESKAHPWRWRAAARTRGELAVGPQPPGRGGWWLAHPVCVPFPRPLGGDLARRQKRVCVAL